MDALADNTARRQKFLEEFDIDPDVPLPDESEDPLSNAQQDATLSSPPKMSSMDLKAQLEAHKARLSKPAEFAIIADGPGALHGKVEAGRNLDVDRGTCDPFVKVTYLPPPPESILQEGHI